MISLSCADFTFPLLPRAAALTVIRAMGFDAVDIGLFERSVHYRTTDLLANPRESAAIVRSECAAAGLRVADVFLQIGVEPSQCAVNDADPAVRSGNRRMFERALDFTAGLGVSRMTGLPGVGESFDLAVEETGWRLQSANQRGIQYSIEPHFGSICDTPGKICRFLDSVPGLTLTLDYGHLIYAGIDNANIHPLCRRASHVHARGGAPGRLQSPVASSTIDFAGMVQLLEDSHYSGFICCEYVWVDWQGCNTTDNVSETLLLRDHLRSCSKSGPGNSDNRAEISGSDSRG